MRRYDTDEYGCLHGTGPAVDCLIIFNTVQPNDCSAPVFGKTNAYCGENVAGIEIADSGLRTIRFVHDLGAFPFPSPNQRFHVVGTPVSYICTLGNGLLMRYDGYAIGAIQPTGGSPTAATGRVLAENVVVALLAGFVATDRIAAEDDLGLWSGRIPRAIRGNQRRRVGRASRPQFPRRTCMFRLANYVYHLGGRER